MLYRNREKPLTTPTTREETNGPQVYGSNRATLFLTDLIAGTNSLDVIIIGDSNTGSSLIGGYGYQSGMCEALNNLGALCYGTQLSPFIDRSPTGASRFYGTWRGTNSTIPKSADFKSGLEASTTAPTDLKAVPYTGWNANSPLVSYGSYSISGTLTSVTITSTNGSFQCSSAYLQLNQLVRFQGTSGSPGPGQIAGSIVGYTGDNYYYIVDTNGSTTFSLSTTYGGTPVTTVVGVTSGLTVTSQADYNDWLYLPTVTPNNIYWSTGVNIEETHPLAANGTTNFYRFRYGQVEGGGRVYPNATSNGAAASLPRLLIGSMVSLQKAGTTAGFEVSEQSFTANGKGHTANAFGYDTNGNNFSQGPGALFCQSLYRKIKGWSVHSHGYQAGEDSTNISNTIHETSTWLERQLQEIRERQISAGGTGRVLIFFHSGINGADTGSTWTAAHQRVWKRYKIAWGNLGYPAAELAIVSIVGVQSNSADISGSGGNLTTVRKEANTMAIQNNDMTVVDVKVLMPYPALTYGTGLSSYYQRFKNSPTIGENITVHLAGGCVEAVTATISPAVTTATSITLTGALAVAADGWWANSRIFINAINGGGAVPANQATDITQYNGTTKVATVAQWTGGTPTAGASISVTIFRRSLADGYTAISQAILSSLIS